MKSADPGMFSKGRRDDSGMVVLSFPLAHKNVGGIWICAPDGQCVYIDCYGSLIMDAIVTKVSRIHGRGSLITNLSQAESRRRIKRRIEGSW
jgi:hypothetical protein